MGNATAIRRDGKISGSTYGSVDDLVYSYDGNMLASVSDASVGPFYSGVFHFSDGADDDVEYEYDSKNLYINQLGIFFIINARF